MATEAEVQNLLSDAIATCDVSFPIQAADNPVTIEERLQALPTHLRAMVFEAIRQGVAMVLAAAQLQFGTEVKVLVVHQAFSSVPDDQDFMDDLFTSVEWAANVS